MNRRCPAFVALIFAIANFIPLPQCAGFGTAPGAELFTNGPVLRISVQISKGGIESLRNDQRKVVHALVKEGDVTYQDVAVHIKGAAGSLRDIDDRPALTLIFNKFVPGQKFHGLSKIHLNNSVQDHAYLDEELCGELFRSAGVPAARAAPAIVSLNGKRLRFYVLKEGFSKEFLKQYFDRTDGNLYDGGFLSDIGDSTHRSSGHGPEDHSDLRALLAAAEESNTEKRWQRLNRLLDVDRFISLMVMETLTLHWDGYSQKSNNYRVYFNPEKGRFVFFAHGMDQMFGRGGYFQSSIFPEMGGSVARAVMSTPLGHAQYTQRLQQIYARSFRASTLAKRVTELSEPIRRELAAQPEALRQYESQVQELRERVVERCEDVGKQLKALPHSDN